MSIALFMVPVFTWLLSMVDFRRLETQRAMFESCGNCDIHISFSQIHNLSRMLIAHVKLVHPDLHPNKSLQDSHPNGSLQESSLQDSHPNASLRCSIQDINNIIDQLREHGYGSLSWLSWKLRIPAGSVHLTMLVVGFLVLALVHKKLQSQVVPSSASPPPRTGLCLGQGVVSKLLAKMLVMLGLARGSNGVVLNDTALVQSMVYSDFAYGLPPCVQYCGRIPSKCTDKGWFFDDEYMFWFDEAEQICKSIKSPVPSFIYSQLSQSSMGLMGIGVVSTMYDGVLDPADVLTLTSLFGVHIENHRMIDEKHKLHKQIRDSR